MKKYLWLLAAFLPLSGLASEAPENLEESLERLDSMFKAEEKSLILENGEGYMNEFHFGMGMRIRNNCGVGMISRSIFSFSPGPPDGRRMDEEGSFFG